MSNKKGVGAVVKAVLLTLVAFGAIGVAWYELRPAVQEVVNSNFNASAVGFKLVPSTLEIDSGGKFIRMKIQRTAGKGNVPGFYLSVEDDSKKGYSQKVFARIEEMQTIDATLNYSAASFSSPKKILIIPILLVDGKEKQGGNIFSYSIQQTDFLKLQERNNPLSCNDGIKNSNETDIDCGGSECDVCVDGKSCKQNLDCSSGNCTSNVCQMFNAPTNSTNSSCSDADFDGYFAGAGCAKGIQLDCKDSNPDAYPGAKEYCGDGIDNNCDGKVDENCASLPSGCPYIELSADKNFVVNGKKIFPMGYWGLYYTEPEWSKYTQGYNAITFSAWDQLTDKKLADNNVVLFDQAGGDVNHVNQYENYNSIMGWEVVHEPFDYEYTSGQIKQQAQDMQQADRCNRAAFITPGISTSDESHLSTVRDSSSILFANIQAAYVVPVVSIKTVGINLKKAADAMSVANKPVTLVMQINGYQPQRYQSTKREPTFDEMRVQAYEGIINGAKGFYMWAYRHASGRTYEWEPDDALYYLIDSSGHYSDVLSLGIDLKAHQSIFISPYSSASVQSSSADVECKIWEVGPSKKISYKMICANVAQDASPNFYYTNGDRMRRFEGKAYTNDESQSFPARYNDETQYPFSKYSLDKNSVVMQDLYTGVTNQSIFVDHISIYFDDEPAGAQFQYAIYEDDARDFSPHKRLYLSPVTNIADGVSKSDGTKNYRVFDITGGVTLKHTTNYYLLIKAVTDGITLEEQRGGAGPMPLSGATVALDSSFGVLYSGKSSSTTLTLSGKIFSSACVEKSAGSLCSSIGISNNQIQDSFDNYAVHIFTLTP